MDPLSGIAASISSSIKIFEMTYQLKAVDEQTANLLSTTRHVDTNLNEARRLRRLKVNLLDAGERAWMDSVIEDTDRALRAVAQLIGPARVDKNIKEDIKLGHKVMWVFRDNPKVSDKHAALRICHQSLTTAIACLYSKDSVVIAPLSGPEKEEKPSPYDPQMEELFNWRNQKRRRKSHMSLRDADVDRPTSTSSVSTNLGSPRTSHPSPLTFATPLSTRSSAAEGFGGRTHLTTSTLVEARIEQTSNPLISHQDDSLEQQLSLSSISTRSAVNSPMSSMACLMDMDVERPLSANWGSPRRKPVPFSSNHKPRLSDTNEHLLDDQPRPLQERPFSSSTCSQSDPQTRQSIFDTKNPYSGSTSSFPMPNGTSRSRSNSNTYLNQSKAENSAHGNCSNADFITMPTLNEIDREPSATITTSYSPHNNARGIQTVYKPYRRPTMSPESESFTTTSTYSSPIFSSDVPSPPGRSSNAGHSPAYNPPRFPGDSRYNSTAFIAELEANIGESVTENRQDGSNRPDHGMGVEALPSQTGRSTSGESADVRRGGRSWLKFHATRSDLGHYTG